MDPGGAVVAARPRVAVHAGRMKLGSRALVGCLLGIVLFGCGIGTREHEAEARRVVEGDARCPDEDVIALDERADEAELLDEELIVLTPLCWYRIEVTGEDYPYCSPSGLGAPYSTLDEVRASSRDAFAPSTWGIKDSRVGRVVCTDEGPVLLVQAAGETCAPEIASDESWESLGLGRTDRWWDDQLEPKELLASDERPAKRLCIYETVKERSAAGCRSPRFNGGMS